MRRVTTVYVGHIVLFFIGLFIITAADNTWHPPLFIWLLVFFLYGLVGPRILPFTSVRYEQL